VTFANSFPLSQVVGVDFGTLNTVIAVARNRGVDVVRRPGLFWLYLLTLHRSQMKSLTEPHRKFLDALLP